MQVSCNKEAPGGFRVHLGRYTCSEHVLSIDRYQIQIPRQNVKHKNQHVERTTIATLALGRI